MVLSGRHLVWWTTIHLAYVACVPDSTFQNVIARIYSKAESERLHEPLTLSGAQK